MVLVADTDPAAAALSPAARCTPPPRSCRAPGADPLPGDAVEAAEALHVPLLLAGRRPGGAGHELDRLGAEQVVRSGDVGDLGDREVVPGADGLPSGAPDPLPDVVALSSGGPETAAAAVTARAAGATVVDTAGRPTPAPRPTPSTPSPAPPSTVLALGTAFDGVAGLDWKTATAARRAAARGRQLLFPHFLVAMYGSTEGPALGVLGEQGLDGSIQRVDDFASRLRPAAPRPDRRPHLRDHRDGGVGLGGPDGNYSTELDPEALRPYVEAAGAAGIYVILDLQPGRTDFLTQAKQYRPCWSCPTSAWRWTRSGAPAGPGAPAQIGSVGIDEVNSVVTWLADLTRRTPCRRSCWCCTSSG